MKTVLKVEKINKHYGKKHVVKDLSFELHEGEILGFIGPNGAGKTTTIKMIVGLQRYERGTITINDYDVKKEFKKAIEKVGSIVESPDLYMYLSGYENLKMISRMYGKCDKKTIDKAIKLSGLDKRIKDKVSTYSLGMRQRLGIAAALINEPNLLILDEPTNGLDPEGIKDLRDLLLSLAKSGLAILISSHNLAELDNFITNVCIICHGETVLSGEASELKHLDKSKYVFKVDDTKKADKLIKHELKIIDDNYFEVICEEDEVSEINALLVDKNIKVYEIKLITKSLEDTFLDETGGNKIV